MIRCLLCLIVAASAAGAAEVYRSHPPLRKPALPLKRPAPTGPTYHVDAERGDDASDGSLGKPWKTIRHALTKLKPGDTLLLRGGTYRENVRISLAGRKNAPITIRSYPAEQAIVDGGLAEFFDKPADAWEPHPKGGPDEYRSKVAHPNLRNVVGSFGDSMIGLHTYYHANDLRAKEEIVVMEADKSDIKPIYCGPGVWYDRETGHLHVRLTHTQLPDLDNYRGETDPRKLPLVIAPFRSVPLHLDRAEHVRLQDLIIRGGGYNTVLLDQASDVELDNVSVWCGTFGLRVKGTQRLRLYRCGIFGNSPPWQTRFEAGFNTYPGRTSRDITRQNTHALLVAEANGEYDVYAFPFNDDWDISYCAFTDAGADGLYLGGVNLHFHHNLIENMTDDGIYLSQMYPRHLYLRGGAKLHLYQNYFSQALTMLAFGGTEDTRDTVYFYRNIVDLRAPVKYGRPSEKGGKVSAYGGKLMGDHGSPPWPSMMSYHNTIIVGSPGFNSHMNLLTGATAQRPRRMFNNILIHSGRWLPLSPGTEFAHADGNLYWQPGLDAKLSDNYFTAYRSSPGFTASKKFYPPGFDTHSVVAHPRFVKGNLNWKIVNDYRLQSGSLAIDAGVALPADWPDPLRKLDKGKPDIGALPQGAESLQVGPAASK